MCRSTVIDNAIGVLTELYEESIEPDEFGALTLHYAAKASIFEIVEMIFDRCVDSSHCCPQATVLLSAVPRSIIVPYPCTSPFLPGGPDPTSVWKVSERYRGAR